MTEKIKEVAEEVKSAMENGEADFLRVTHQSLTKLGFPKKQRGYLINQVAREVQNL